MTQTKSQPVVRLRDAMEQAVAARGGVAVLSQAIRTMIRCKPPSFDHRRNSATFNFMKTGE